MAWPRQQVFTKKDFDQAKENNTQNTNDKAQNKLAEKLTRFRKTLGMGKTNSETLQDYYPPSINNPLAPANKNRLLEAQIAEVALNRMPFTIEHLVHDTKIRLGIDTKILAEQKKVLAELQQFRRENYDMLLNMFESVAKVHKGTPFNGTMRNHGSQPLQNHSTLGDDLSGLFNLFWLGKNKIANLGRRVMGLGGRMKNFAGRQAARVTKPLSGILARNSGLGRLYKSASGYAQRAIPKALGVLGNLKGMATRFGTQAIKGLGPLGEILGLGLQAHQDYRDRNTSSAGSAYTASAAGGALSGAIGGAALFGIPTLGLGAPLGALVGAAAGSVLSLATTAIARNFDSIKEGITGVFSWLTGKGHSFFGFLEQGLLDIRHKFGSLLDWFARKENSAINWIKGTAEDFWYWATHNTTPEEVAKLADKNAPKPNALGGGFGNNSGIGGSSSEGDNSPNGANLGKESIPSRTRNKSGNSGGGNTPSESSEPDSSEPDSQGGKFTPKQVEKGKGRYGNLPQYQQEAYAAARNEGLSDSAARALVANMSGEALFDPSNTTGDQGTAKGIVQWHKARSGPIEEHFGKPIEQMTVAEQTKAAIWEIKTNPTYSKTWQTLKDPNTSTEEKLGTLVTNYEAPGDTATAYSQRLQHLRQFKPQFSFAEEKSGQGSEAKPVESGAKPIEGEPAPQGNEPQPGEGNLKTAVPGSQKRKIALLAAGTNDWQNEDKAYAGVKASIAALKTKGYTPVLVLPNQSVHGSSAAYDGALRAANEAKIDTETPTKWDSKESYHIDPGEAKRIAAKYPGAYITGDSNSVRLGAKEGVSGFTGMGSEDVAGHIKSDAPTYKMEENSDGPEKSYRQTIRGNSSASPSNPSMEQALKEMGMREVLKQKGNLSLKNETAPVPIPKPAPLTPIPKPAKISTVPPNHFGTMEPDLKYDRLATGYQRSSDPKVAWQQHQLMDLAQHRAYDYEKDPETDLAKHIGLSGTDDRSDIVLPNKTKGIIAHDPRPDAIGSMNRMVNAPEVQDEAKKQVTHTVTPKDEKPSGNSAGLNPKPRDKAIKEAIGHPTQISDTPHQVLGLDSMTA